MKQSRFRNWCTEKYFEHKDELAMWHEESEPIEKYFARNRWWLRSQFRNEQDDKRDSAQMARPS